MAVIGVLPAFLVEGCVIPLVRTPVPAELVERASIDGFENIRFWGDAIPTNLEELAEIAIEQRAAQATASEQSPRRFLAISGGGRDGAFGAGFLVGWTANGMRPAFDIVTGISTGALIAPFAFLGPGYDDNLTEMFTRYRTSDLLAPQVLTGLLGGTALADSAPLRQLIAKYITQDFFGVIATEHRKGRRLLVGTTNLDAQRPVIWDMGAIAASERPGALALFRDILLASASMPVAFPPVRIEVRVDGKDYDELHADGGITTQVFFLPSQIQLPALDQRLGQPTRQRELYIIRNDQIGPAYRAVDSNLTSIADRAIATVTKNQAAGELLRLYLTSQRDDVAFRLAYIPSSFDAVNTEAFDRVYMQALFKMGYDLARNGYDWASKLPADAVLPVQ